MKTAIALAIEMAAETMRSVKEKQETFQLAV
jgi:hypothetical protein